ncbi:hypothetical protein ILYODFUR_034387 [Ilyodon furcidens]|uniref:Secreted protein n=1 Tax=Ilyodon furcidens TaxID=33524 RepID=A0ABV0UXN3_9TELE
MSMSVVVCVLPCYGLATCPGCTPPPAHRLLEIGTSSPTTYDVHLTVLFCRTEPVRNRRSFGTYETSVLLSSVLACPRLSFLSMVSSSPLRDKKHKHGAQKLDAMSLPMPSSFYCWYFAQGAISPSSVMWLLLNTPMVVCLCLDSP